MLLEDLIIQLHMGDGGVGVLDDADSLMAIAAGVGLDVELLAGILGVHADAAGGGVFPGCLIILCGCAGEYLQPVGGMSRHAAEGRGNFQAHHAGAGDAHAHCIFEDVAAHPQLDLLRQLPEGLAGLGHRQRHGNGLRAAKGGLDFPAEGVQIMLVLHLTSP